MQGANNRPSLPLALPPPTPDRPISPLPPLPYKSLTDLPPVGALLADGCTTARSDAVVHHAVHDLRRAAGQLEHHPKLAALAAVHLPDQILLCVSEGPPASLPPPLPLPRD